MSDKPSVIFVCVHNAGRSQMAAGFTTALSGGAVEVRSAGSGCLSLGSWSPSVEASSSTACTALDPADRQDCHGDDDKPKKEAAQAGRDFVPGAQS